MYTAHAVHPSRPPAIGAYLLLAFTALDSHTYGTQSVAPAAC